MRVASVAFAALSITLATFALASGCGLDPIDVQPTTVDANIDVAPVRRDSGGVLDGETSKVPDGAVVDAGTDADEITDGGCPTQCTSCTDAGVCEIECTGGFPCGGTTQCPKSRPCRVVCKDNNSCWGTTVQCANLQTCSVVCEKAGSCKQLSVIRNFSTHFCLDCVATNSCDGINCGSAGTCSKACGNMACNGLSFCDVCGSETDGTCK